MINIYRFIFFLLIIFFLNSCVNTSDEVKKVHSDSSKVTPEKARKDALNAQFLTPIEAVKAMTHIDGYNVNSWASEPLMTQPMAFCWDDKGRLWIAENKDYEARGRGFSNSGKSRILILEDTNHDGQADTRKVFIEGIAFPAALAVGFDGVFVGAPPNLLFIPDRNHDDVADLKDIEIRLTGWGIADRHETLNSFIWGPDGWLYGCEGYATTSRVRKPSGKAKLYKYRDPFPENILEGEGTDINGGVWRYHPIKDKFEVVAHGFSNPWGIDYDSNGQIFITACVIPHIWHVLPGGVYHRQGGQHFNPFVYDDIKTIADHQHLSAHGGARIYQSDAFPSSQKGRIFMGNIHQHAVLSDVLKPQGSGFIASHGDDFLLANNAQFVGFSMEIGPEGGLYVLDWHDADICGQKVLNSETGRIYRIMPEKSEAQSWPDRFSDLNKLTNEALVQLQTSKSDWHARRARVILQSRAAKREIKGEIYPELLNIYRSSINASFRLRAMWTLHITKTMPQNMLVNALDDKNEYIRGWAIQLLCEDRSVSKEISAKFVLMAAKDTSPVVRVYLASAMQRLNKNIGWEIGTELVKHAEDANDHNLPKMVWYGLEPLVGKDPRRGLSLASEVKIPLIASFIARRAVDAGALSDLVKSINAEPKTLESLMEGMMNGIEGSTDIKPPALWQSVYLKFKKKDNKIAQLAEEISQLFGNTESAQRSLAIVTNKTMPLEKRINAMRLLAAQQRKELLVQLPDFLDDPLLRMEAIKSVAAFDNENLGRLLIKKYNNLNTSEKSEAAIALSSRPASGWTLAEALQNNVIPKSDISANVARQLRRVVGSGFVEIWGPIDDKPMDKKEYAKYKNLLSEDAIRTSDMKKGKEVFKKTCGSCHKMYGEGGNIGPELTGSNRSDIDYLFFNILNPSEEIQDAYKLIVITTRDGRTYSGNIVSENERQIIMRVVGQDSARINKSSIQSKEVTSASMMPQGLLKTLTDKEIIDLISYLKKAGQ